MKFSIITVAYNSDTTIGETIASVLQQTYGNIEYIVVDGLSRDRTLGVAQEAEPKFAGRMKIVSERDAGIYDAMNKGLTLASGDIVGFLNADDIFVDEQVIEDYAALFKASQATAIYSDLVYVSKDDPTIVKRRWKAGAFPRAGMKYGWHPAHPTFYVKREHLQKFGGFKTRFKVAADYELMLRLIEKHRIYCEYLPRTTVRMRLGGESNRSIKNIVRANLECVSGWQTNGLSISPLTIPLKLLWKMGQSNG